MLGIYSTDNQFGFMFFKWEIPFWRHYRFGGFKSWGIGYLDNDVYLTWGSHYKFIYMPWKWEHRLCEVMLKDNTFVTYDKFSYANRTIAVIPEPIEMYKEIFDYTYKLRSGEIQERKATVTVERRTWSWRWWKWKTKIETAIQVEFNDEVGERTGSYKGGVVGCGYTMQEGESPHSCLRRMEREHEFL